MLLRGGAVVQVTSRHVVVESLLSLRRLRLYGFPVAVVRCRACRRRAVYLSHGNARQSYLVFAVAHIQLRHHIPRVSHLHRRTSPQRVFRLACLSQRDVDAPSCAVVVICRERVFRNLNLLNVSQSYLCQRHIACVSHRHSVQLDVVVHEQRFRLPFQQLGQQRQHSVRLCQRRQTYRISIDNLLVIVHIDNLPAAYCGRGKKQEDEEKAFHSEWF